jgi:hypothetical protein
MDGDGIPEIVTACDHEKVDELDWPYLDIINTRHTAIKIKVFPGSDRSDEIEFPTVEPFFAYGSQVIAIAKTKIAGRDSALIVVAEYDMYLRAYSMYGDRVWTSSAKWTDDVIAQNVPNPAVGFADFNNDGYAEVYAGNSIFDAATGILLCKGAGNDGKASSGCVTDGTRLWTPYITIAADVHGDARLELVAGNQIYDVVITNRTGTSGNAMTVIQQITPPTCIEDPLQTVYGDGHTQVADIDGDGHLDVIVENKTADGSAFV